MTADKTITIEVTPVNDAPAGADSTVTINEDTSLVLMASQFGFSDVNDNPANTLAGVKITTLPGAGSLTLNGAAVIAGQFIGIAEINAGHLVFTPAANANGDGYASLTFQVQDNGGTANGSVNLDATPNTLTINVAAVNDAPVVGGAVTGTATEDGASVTLDALAKASDVDAGTTLSVTGLPGTLPAGVIYDPTTHSFTLDPSNAAYQSLAAGHMTTVTVNYSVSDGTVTTPASVSWTVTGTNDAAVIGAPTVSAVTEDVGVTGGNLTGTARSR